MSHYLQLLGSDTPNGYGGCCYYGALDHPALREPAFSAAAGPTLSTREAPPASWHSYAVYAKATAPALTLVPSVKESAHGTPRQLSPAAEAAEASVPSPWNSPVSPTGQRPTWPHAGPFHSATLLHPQPPSPPVRSAAVVATASPPYVTVDAGFSGSEGYIFFNCPEGTQRFSSEANIKLRKVRGFFFTRWSCTRTDVSPIPSSTAASVAENAQHGGTSADPATDPADAATLEMPVGAASAVMGLPGMLFTINDAGARHATFFGPSAVLDNTPQPARVDDVTRTGACNGDGGREPHNTSDEQAYGHACGYSGAGDSASTSSTGGAAVAAQEAPLTSPLSSAGLRGFLTTLRFHYFQYRPMIFRQLHGLVRHAPDQIAIYGDSVDVTIAAAVAGNNQLHFLETVGEPTAVRDAPQHSPLTERPIFVHATLPLSSQSLLVAFHVSGGRREGEGKGAAAAAAAAAASGAKMRVFRPSSPSAVEGDEPPRRQTRPTHGAVHPERGDQRADADSAEPTVSFTAPTSHDVVFGYAIIVAPGPSFDAAKARALGVRSGPKYGQLKLGMPVEADMDTEVADTPAASVPLSQNDTASPGHTNDQSPTPTQRWVHPHQVMRPTTATRHAYVSLVLDGDRPEDVRGAVTRLLGSASGGDGGSPTRNSAVACEEAEDKDKSCRSAAGGGLGTGVLQWLLCEHFPHLAYYYDDEDDEVGERTAATPTRSQEPRLRRQPRQLVVRHVVHVQPTSYFAQFERRFRASRPPCSPFVHRSKAQTQPKTPPPSLHHEASARSVYAAYNAYVFADVSGQHDPLHHHRRVCAAVDHCEEEAVPVRVEASCDALVDSNVSSPTLQNTAESIPAVQLSLAPSLSFTLEDMADAAGGDAETGEEREREGGSTRIGKEHRAHSPRPLLQWGSPEEGLQRYKTWHLFTSYVQRHFTAFPTALVHRYHLHHLAPSLFPIVGVTTLSQRICGAGNATEDCAACRDTAGGVAASTEALGSGGTVGTQRAKPNVPGRSSSSADDAVEYWPYSLKLRCIPDGTLQLPYNHHGATKTAVQTQEGTEMTGRVRQAPSTVNTSLDDNVAAAAAAAAASPHLPTARKRGRQGSSNRDDVSAPACTAHVSISSSGSAPSATPIVLPPGVKAVAASRTRCPSAPPRPVAVVDGVASLLPYPTPASALALLSNAFLRSLGTGAAVGAAAAAAAEEVPATSSTLTGSPAGEQDNSAALQQRMDVPSTGMYGMGGGALGFLGTGSAVPSKYRNVSGTFLELHLPAYCFPGGVSPTKPVLHDGHSVHASGAAAVVADGTLSATSTKPPTGKATCAWREGNALLGVGSADFSTCSRSCTTARTDGSQTTESLGWPSAPLTTSSQQLRRGVVILDFGEGSAGQLASLCRRVRSCSTCSKRPPTCSFSVPPLHPTVDSHQGILKDRCEGAGDHAEGAGTNMHCPHAASSENSTELGDDADARLGQFVLDIVLVFISHAHADHHLGLMSLLTLRHEYRQRGTSALLPTPKLLVVCPTEVYAFMMDAWGGTEPYTTWLHEECTFDLMPPPVRTSRTEGQLRRALTAEEGDAAPDGLQTMNQNYTTVAGSNASENVADAEHEQNLLDDGDVGSGGAASSTHRLSHKRHAVHASDNQTEQQHVVPMPRLQAHLAAWNEAIEVGIRCHQRTPLSHSPLSSSSEPLADTSVTAAAASAERNVWWDAEVITVDHPANAHALLLRFPFCSSMKDQGEHGVCGEAAHGATRTTSANVAEAVTERQCSQELLACAPDSSRVLIFSGDTRPSSFLVERSSVFTASAQSRLRRCSGSTELSGRDWLVSNEANSVSAPEGGGVTVAAKVNASARVGKFPGTTLAQLPTSTPPSLPSPVFILLHEATFGPGLEGEAVRKKHSTLPEALRVGVAVRAAFVVLNHFSQRYPKLPGLSQEQLGGRSADFVCQRRTRASAAVATASAGDASEGESPDHLVSGHRVSEGAQRQIVPGEPQKLTGKGSSTALWQDGGHDKEERDADHALPPPSPDTGDAAASPYENMSFAFDLMSVSFRDLQRGLMRRLTPTLARLLEEYDSWGIGTTQRMRSGGGGGGGGAGGRRRRPQKRQQQSSATPPTMTSDAPSGNGGNKSSATVQRANDDESA